MEYLVVSNVKRLAKAKGRRVGKDFLCALDNYIARKVESACQVKNGSKITLDYEIAQYLGLTGSKSLHS